VSSEATFSKLVKSHLPAGAHWQRIETGSTGTGIPDVNICYKGKEIWVELKLIKGKRVDLSPTQVAWHMQRAKAGGITWILARHTYDGVRKGKGDNIYLWQGNLAKVVKEIGIDAGGYSVWQNPFAWENIMNRIFNV
tara:strand:- start:3224 stop:3634 length:411 start_codon:yes stop_codon:yes gene_type:complete